MVFRRGKVVYRSYLSIKTIKSKNGREKSFFKIQFYENIDKISKKINIFAQNRGYMVRPPKNRCLDVNRDQRRIRVKKISFLANSYAENGPNEDLRFFDFVNPITIWDSFSY